jgi:hypothetical protein
LKRDLQIVEPTIMTRNIAALKWLIPGVFLLSFLALQVAGSSITIFHTAAIRTELVEIRQVSYIHAVTYAKAIHLTGHTHSPGYGAAPKFSCLAARLYTQMAEMQVKNSEIREPFRLKMFFRLKIPSPVDSDVGLH